MADPHLPLLEDAVRKLLPFLDEIVFFGGATLGLLITDEAAAPIRGTTDVDVIAEIVTYADYIDFSDRLRRAGFTEDTGEQPLTCRWHDGSLTLDILPNIWYEPALRHASIASDTSRGCTQQPPYCASDEQAAIRCAHLQTRLHAIWWKLARESHGRSSALCSRADRVQTGSCCCSLASACHWLQEIPTFRSRSAA